MTTNDKPIEINDYDKEIVNRLNTACSHTTYYSYNNKSYICQTCCEIMSTAFDKGIILKNETIGKFLQSLTGDQKGYYYIDYRCIYRNSGCLSNTIYTLFLLHDVTATYLKEYIDLFVVECISVQEYDMCFKILGDKKYNFTNIFNTIIKRLQDFCDKWNDKDFCDTILNNIDKNTSVINELCGTRSTYMNVRMAQFIDKYDGIIDIENLYTACKVLPYSKELINVLVNKGLQLDSKCLEIVCSSCDVESIDYLLVSGRIPIEKIHYQALIKSKKYKPVDNDNNRYKRYNKDDDEDEYTGYTEEKMEILIKHGYNPDYDDVAFAIKYKKQIPNISRFNINLDKSLLELCWDYDFYPNYNFECIDLNMIELQKLCRGKSKNNIVKFIKQHNIIPDRKCMENACSFKNNNSIITTLINSGGKLTYKCIKLCGQEFSASSTLEYIIDEYEKIMTQEKNEYINRIKFLENKLIDLIGEIPQEKNDQNVINNTNKIHNVKQKKCKRKIMKEKNISNTSDTDENDSNTSDIKNSNKNKIMKRQKDISSASDISDTDDVYPIKKNRRKPINNIKNKRKIIRKQINLSDTDDVSEIESDFINNKLENNKLIITLNNQLPEGINKKQSIPKLYSEYFNIKKNIKMSFLEIKKELLETIRNKNWFDKNDKSLIDIPSDLKNKLNLNDGLIRFIDLDKFVALFYR